MPGVVGLSLLVCVCAVGLATLAVRAPAREHTLAVAMTVLVAIPVAAASVVTGAALLLVAGASLRLRPVVPTHVPEEWSTR